MPYTGTTSFTVSNIEHFISVRYLLTWTPLVTSRWVSTWGPCLLLALGIRIINFQRLKPQRWTRTAQSCVASHATAIHNILMAGDRHLLNWYAKTYAKLRWDMTRCSEIYIWLPGVLCNLTKLGTQDEVLWHSLLILMEQLGNSRKSGCVKSNSAVAEEGQNAAAKLNREGRIIKLHVSCQMPSLVKC